MHRLKCALVLLLALSSLAGAASAQGVAAEVQEEVERLLEEYVARIKSKEAAAIAEMYHYPYKTVHPGGEEQTFATRQELIRFLEAEQAQIGDFEAIEVSVREISLAGSRASVKADTRVTVVIEGKPTTFLSQVEFRLVRSGETWLISEEWTLAMDVTMQE